jgi:hypothetical protein
MTTTLPVSVIVQPDTGKTFRLGRHAPKVIFPHLHLRNYLMKSLPAPPTSVDYSILPATWLANVLANDELGCCLDSASFHVGGLLLANAEQPIPFSVNDVINFYSATAGYVRGNPSTDVGGTWQQTLAYWQLNELTPDNHRIEGYASVNPEDPEEIQTAMWLFENVVIGISLPDEWINPMPSGSGFVWDVAGKPNLQSGHAICGVASVESAGLTIDTWGYKGLLTWPAVAKYCSGAAGGEIYTVFSRDAISTAMGVAPSGFDFAALTSDLTRFTSFSHHHHHRPRLVLS